ncbi:LytTR family transcriptional regulator DNA-binding domain-containing protein [Mucilaginibacter sp. Mucisp86]|uniref:LytTR family transcriptional regulator DNA-binding domain-containing protein n=1 Tax=Mucilaginibacter sp. Mucisp86 TaxID=3243060 RepID=UPI0039B557F1
MPIPPYPVKPYNDLLFRIVISVIAAHFIISFGIDETFFQLLLLADYYESLAGSAIIAFLLISLVRGVSTRLDRDYDWREKPLVRALLQILFGVVIISVAAFLLATIYFLLNGINILKTVYLKYDFPVIVIFIFLLNIYYLCFYLIRQLSSPVGEQATAAGASFVTVFIVNKGTENLPVTVGDVAIIYHEGKYNFIKLFDAVSYLISQSLDQVEKQLDPEQFFRVSRTMIISRRACKSFIILDYGRLEVVTDPVMKEPVIVSQKRSPVFKKWLELKTAKSVS